MPTYLTLRKNGYTIGVCGPTRYDSPNSTCTCICQGANHGRGQTHAQQTAQLLARTLAVRYKLPGDQVNVHRYSLSPCLFHRDTEHG